MLFCCCLQAHCIDSYIAEFSSFALHCIACKSVDVYYEAVSRLIMVCTWLPTDDDEGE